MADHPFDEVCTSASALIEQGHSVFQKFTCSSCGSRQTIDVPNTFYTQGSCEECHHITDIKAQGCNYMMITNMPITEDERARETERNKRETAERMKGTKP